MDQGRDLSYIWEDLFHNPATRAFSVSDRIQVSGVFPVTKLHSKRSHASIPFVDWVSVKSG